MTAVDDRPTTQPTCVKRDDGRSCTARPVVRYAVGPVCSRHQVFGAEALEWLVDDAVVVAVSEGLRAAVMQPSLPAAVEQKLRNQLPDPARPKAAQHADAAPGESAGARLVAYRAGAIRGRVLEHLVQAGSRGTTAIETWRWYRASYSPTTERYSVAPRLSELVGDGWAVKTGGTRNVRGPGYPPEEVYVLSARGRREKGLTW